MVGATTATTVGAFQLESIAVLDLRLLSQSEIYSLSLRSSSAFDPDRCNDVVIPKIDRSVFNESAGSRKQTYSRLRLLPPSSSPSAAHRRRTPRLRHNSASIINSGNSDSENVEKSQMLPLFKKLFVSDINLGDSFPVKIDHSHPVPSDPAPVEDLSGHKRKREDEKLDDQTKPGAGDNVVHVKDNSSLKEVVVARENVDDRDRVILNRDGVVVDFAALGLVDHPYSEDIRRRTEGLSTVEELVKFLGGFKGRWDSSRKKKRTVDAGEFGSVLPIGWKLLLSIEKKMDSAWLSCARYIRAGNCISKKVTRSCGVYQTWINNFKLKTDKGHFIFSVGILCSLTTRTSKVHDAIIKLFSLHQFPTYLPHYQSDLFSSNKYVKHPSGRQFVSCKEASSYLLTLTGVQDTDPTITAQHNEIVDDKSTSTRVADIATEDVDIKESLSSHASDAKVLPGKQLGEILLCDKCNVTFCKSDESLHYLSSIHLRNGYKNVVRTTDPVIMNENKKVDDASNSACANNACSAETNFEENVPCLVGEYTVDEMYFGTDSVIPSRDEKEISMPGKNDSEVVGLEGIKIDPFVNNETQNTGSIFNMLHQGMGSNVPGGDNILNSCQDLGGSWGTGQENLFEGYFDDLVANTGDGGDTNESTSVCVWCRSLFYHQEQLETQTGAIGSLCPSCSTRMPGQL
ncbi:methyl-CpG-binding domain-containing protein [Castilleja foliolosa]|uniref:Methyl-CpG-binding domain-containing protein n=1 Tax=Castilleja foliolosa TaxID=1961234 RepID=A0ABD3BQY0_9LAMI